MRNCARCGTKLPGRRGHGFVTRDGKSVICSGEAIQGKPGFRDGDKLVIPPLKKVKLHGAA